MSFFFFALAVESGEKIHICFFELDNTKTSENFISSMPDSGANACQGDKKFTSSGTVAHCYRPESGETGRAAFERMIDDGQKCDSLVLSGHHTGDWFGEEGEGVVLWLKDMEALSCKSKYKGWFSKIKALWLDGCNTVTDDSIRKSDAATIRLADKRLTKNKEVREGDITRYQQSYSGSLDKDTPLSSRYLRMFPNTQIYGFNGAAPTGDQKNRKSFIYNHLSLLGKALTAEERAMDDQFQINEFERGLAALIADDCDEEKMKAWVDVIKELAQGGAIENQDYKQAYRLGCDLILAKQVLDNPESPSAQKALARHIKKQNNKQNLPRAKQRALDLANQILNTATSAEEKKNSAIELAKMSIVETLKSINEEDAKLNGAGGGSLKNRYTHLLFNNIYDTWNTAKKYKTKDRGFFNAVRSEFQKEGFTEPLKKRIKSPVTASLKKGDYLKFYAEIYDLKNQNIQNAVCRAQNGSPSSGEEKICFVANHVEQLVKKAVSNFSELESSRSGKFSDEARRTLSVSVVDQLFQYDFFSKQRIKKLIEDEGLFPNQPANTQNTFIMDMKLRMAFSVHPDSVFSKVGNPKHSLSSRSAIWVVAEKYIDQFDKDKSPQAKKQLTELADEIDLTDGNVEEGKDFYAFFQALDRKLQGREPKEQADFLLNISRGTGKNLEEITIHYANSIFTKDSEGEEPEGLRLFCRGLNREKENRNIVFVRCNNIPP